MKCDNQAASYLTAIEKKMHLTLHIQTRRVITTIMEIDKKKKMEGAVLS